MNHGIDDLLARLDEAGSSPHNDLTDICHRAAALIRSQDAEIARLRDLARVSRVSPMQKVWPLPRGAGSVRQ
jgi:hypothetical protein